MGRHGKIAQKDPDSLLEGKLGTEGNVESLDAWLKRREASWVGNRRVFHDEWGTIEMANTEHHGTKDAWWGYGPGLCYLQRLRVKARYAT